MRFLPAFVLFLLSSLCVQAQPGAPVLQPQATLAVPNSSLHLDNTWAVGCRMQTAKKRAGD